MSRNPYKDLYDAMKSSDEWSGVRAEEARKRIEDAEYAASWTGDKPTFETEYEFSGGG